MAANHNQELRELGVSMAKIPLQAGVTPRRWQQSINVMLEKVAGLNQVDKLHIIHLFEADFNANNKWLGHVIMKKAESKQLLDNEQYGSQKMRSAIAQCLNKWLWCDLI